MNKSGKFTGAKLVVYALEQLGITHTFGIPGVHNTELYDELKHNEKISPVLVVNEQSGAFIAEGMSRVSQNRNIGTLMIVPAAGFTHAMSGIGEAFLDGVPMLVLTGGVRTDTDWQFKLHDVNQLELARGITKAAFRLNDHESIVPTIFEAYRIATSGCPGPVLVEIPVNLQFTSSHFSSLPVWQEMFPPRHPSVDDILQAAEQLYHAENVGIFVGWGAREAQDSISEIADFLQAPVATTLQGLSSFPSNHPLHTGFGFGPSSVPASRNAFKHCDAILTIGARYSEIPTGSFALKLPETHVHVDIDPQVIGANYPVSTALIGDAQRIAKDLLYALKRLGREKQRNEKLLRKISNDKKVYRKEWYQHSSGQRVNPVYLFDHLRKQLSQNAVIVLDDGNHTYLAAELLPLYQGDTLLTPTDFNAMGYAVPAAIGAKMASPDREVVAIVGDGCFAMTCMELMTAVREKLGIVYLIFNDGELSQIAQAQALPYRDKACTKLPGLKIKGIADATGASYLQINKNQEIEHILKQSREIARHGVPVIVDVAIDYSKPTVFTTQTAKSNFKTFAIEEKIFFIKRIITRTLQSKFFLGVNYRYDT